MRNVLVGFVLAFIVTFSVYAANPFLKNSSDSKTNAAMSETTVGKVETNETKNENVSKKYPTFFRAIMFRISNTQAKLNKKISSLFSEVKENHSVPAVLLVLLLSFVYGSVHALGPGHGKVVVTTYFASRKSTPIEAVILGSLVAFMHAFSAIAVIAGVYFIVRRSMLMSFEETSSVISVISAALVTAVGVFLIVMLVREIVKYRTGKHAESKPDDHDGDKKEYANIFAVAASIGLIPCPGAALMLLFSIRLGVVPLGVAAVVAMSVGMALTISMFGVGAILANKAVFKLPVFGTPNLRKYIGFTVKALGALVVVLMGVYLITSSVL